MTHLFSRVAAWIARQLFPPAGRHRQLPFPCVTLAPIAVSSSAGSAFRTGQAAPRWSLIRAEEIALVRPYVLAAERQRQRQRRGGCGCGPRLAATA